MKHDTYLKYAVIILIVLSIAAFAIDFGVESHEGTVNQLDRSVIIAAYSIVGIVFFYFSLRLLK